MPELPEVETIRRGLKPLIEKRKINDVIVSCDKSFRGKVEDVRNARIEAVRRRGKALLLDLDNDNTMLIHLRMTGQLIFRSSSPEKKIKDFAGGHPNKSFVDELPNAQTRVIFGFETGKLFFNDQRKFGFVQVLKTGEVENEPFIAGLGPEPWHMKVEELHEKCQRHAKAPIKAVLLDQKVVAGIGNIYADESLYYAGVHPAELAGKLSRDQVTKILEGACLVMQKSIDSGGSTMATYVRPDGSTGDYLELFAKVFRREGKKCERCGEIIQKTRVAGRGTHYCPKCQIIRGGND